MTTTAWRDYTIRLGEKCTVRFMDKEIGSFDTYDEAMAFARSHDNEQPIRCSFEGCWRTTWQPYTDGWAGLASWGPGIPDGFYCKQHAAAIDAADDAGELGNDA
jgi:hypothetical protein